MAGDLVAGGGQRLADLGDEFQRPADGEGGQRQAAGGEQLEDAPDAGARAVFVQALDARVALARAWRAPRQLVQVSLGLGVAIEDAGFRALLDVQHELHGDARLARPVRMGWAAGVADEVAPGHQPSSKVVTPNTRSCASAGTGPRYMRAQPNTSTIPCWRTRAMAAGLFSGASRNSGPPAANSAKPE
ncbi:hypothetical protein D3C85_209870 [compost metagenome]